MRVTRDIMLHVTSTHMQSSVLGPKSRRCHVQYRTPFDKQLATSGFAFFLFSNFSFLFFFQRPNSNGEITTSLCVRRKRKNFDPHGRGGLESRLGSLCLLPDNPHIGATPNNDKCVVRSEQPKRFCPKLGTPFSRSKSGVGLMENSHGYNAKTVAGVLCL